MINKGKIHRFIRKSHRYLGVILGIQFMAWTLGGLYFSWTDIEEIRGENLRAEKKLLPIPFQTASLGVLLDSLQNANQMGISFKNIQVVEILGKAFYQIHVVSPQEAVMLFDMESLKPKASLSEIEAIEVARQSLKTPSEIVRTAYLTSTNGHHEYREKPLPAYAVTFDAPNFTTVYVSASLGTVQSFRNDSWRIFDFLWMLHTMDYEGRDDFNNWLLRSFSIFGLITILSGFALYFITLKLKIKKI